jgi:prepilin-type N-terminal cleavage/methylation domain-containing protein
MLTAKQNNRARRAFSCGFTVIEIIVVVVILAIAAAVAIPLLGSADSMRVNSAANIVAADLEYAKSLAITKGQNYTVVFDASAESYRIEDSTGNVIGHPVKKGFDYVMDFSQDSRLSKVDIVTVNFASSSEVTFDYLGSPDNGGYVSIGCDGTSMKVNVEPVTGFISIEDVD